MKRKVILLLVILLLTGCNNKVEEEKNYYLTYKEELQAIDNFTKAEDLTCDITTSVDRLDDEEISYRVIIDNPKENMYNVKALIIHDYFTEDVFPSIGIFDDAVDLIVGDEEVKGITLVGYIDTTKDINDLSLELRVWISYENENGEQKEIYYKSTN